MVLWLGHNYYYRTKIGTKILLLYVGEIIIVELLELWLGWGYN